MKTSKIIAAYAILNSSKLTKMDGKGKVKMVKIINAMKPAYTEYLEKLEEATKRLRPEWYTQEKESEWNFRGIYSDKLTGEEKSGIREYLSNMELCMKDDFDREQDVKYDHLSEDEFVAYAESNDFTAGQLVELQEIIA